MNQIDKTKFAGSLLAVAEMYDKAISPEYVDIYWLALSEYELDDVRAAWGKHLKNTENGMYMPKPADVIKIITGGQKSAALEGWWHVLMTIRANGSLGIMTTGDLRLDEVVEKLGGMKYLCSLTSEQLEKKRVEFEVMYNRESQKNLLSPAAVDLNSQNLKNEAHSSHSFKKVIPWQR